MEFKPFKMGKYLLMERLATGGMAEVYRAKAGGAGGFEKQVAIKRILPNYSQNEEFRKMFEYEARLSSMLTHANIAQVYDFNKFGETFLLAMEYVDGKNLRQFVNKVRKSNVQIPIEFSAFIINEVCKGLDYAHSKKDDMTGKPLNIIHRDMSPQNIMLSYDGAVKIVDFGIAKAKDRVDETRSGIIKGKFGYMSPEQANGMPVDHKTDLFSTGIILWELLTGRRLFSAESDMATLRMIQECVITPPSKLNPRVNPELEKIVMKALSKDLKLRYSSAGDFHRQLLEYLNKNAPTFTQREVASILQKAFGDEIAKEKKRFEQLYRQSIPFSQGVGKAESSDEGMAGVAEVLDGMQTKSDHVESTGETFSDENKVEDSSAESEKEATSVSYTLDEEISGSEAAGATRSQISIPTEKEPSTPDESIPTEAATNNDSSEIEIKPESDELDIVLPGGRKHSLTKTPTDAFKKGPNRVDSDGPPVPGGTVASKPKDDNRKWGDIMPMGKAKRTPKKEPPEPRSALNEVKQRTGERTRTDGGMSKAPASRQRASEKIEVVANREPQFEPTPLREWRPARTKPEKPRRKPILHPMVRLVIVLGVTGYVFKLYFDGRVATFIENAGPRQPTEASGSSPIRSETDPVSVDRKPVGDCTLNVRSQPPGAEVFEGKNSLGPTPVVMSGPCNRAINISLRKEGYEILTENVVIGAKTSDWYRSLKPIPMGRLALMLGFNAEVLINGESVRNAQARVPLEIPLRAKRKYRLKLVNHTLSVNVESDVSIEEGRKTIFNLSLDEATTRSRASRR